MKKLEELSSKCKGEVNIYINGHRSAYHSVQSELEEYHEDYANEISNDILSEMIKRDKMVWVQFYPNTPVGFNSILHYDLEMAIDECLSIINLSKIGKK